jgi:signal recognition particle receptor subunit beta
VIDEIGIHTTTLLAGQKKIRMLWHHYFSGSKALIFIVDSNDRERIDEGKCAALQD